jgi:uncharacterized protein YaiI (UPF0178 family)
LPHSCREIHCFDNRWQKHKQNYAGRQKRDTIQDYPTKDDFMTIWVDADACPNVIKEILYRAAERMQMPLVLVANQSLRVPPSRFIRTLRVAAGFDVADNEIVRQCEAGDLVITADIPLAAEAIEKGAAAINPRGERYTPATIRERLTMRDFMDTLRASGIQTGGPDSLSQRDRQAFAAELEKWWLEVQRSRGQM